MGEEILKIKFKKNKCPKATKDLELNTRNRNEAIKSDHIKYGPINLTDEDYWIDLVNDENAKIAMNKWAGQRAIGVVYDPAHEKYGNYVETNLSKRYDYFVWLQSTSPL